MIDTNRLEVGVHEAVNNVREVRNLPQLSLDSKLSEIARSHSEDMSKRGFVGHSTPTGTNVGDRYDRFDYDCKVPVSSHRYVTAGENIAKLYHGVPSERSDGKKMRYDTVPELAHGAVWGWMNSDGHRENLLRSCWRSEGIGVSVNGKKVYITQNFC